MCTRRTVMKWIHVHFLYQRLKVTFTVSLFSFSIFSSLLLHIIISSRSRRCLSIDSFAMRAQIHFGGVTVHAIVDLSLNLWISGRLFEWDSRPHATTTTTNYVLMDMRMISNSVWAWINFLWRHNALLTSQQTLSIHWTTFIEFVFLSSCQGKRRRRHNHWLLIFRFFLSLPRPEVN